MVMKTTYSILYSLLLSTVCRAQIANNDNWSYLVVTPTKFEQKLLDSMIKNYQIHNNKNQFVFFCWRPIEEDLGTINISSDNSKRIQSTDKIKIGWDETYNYLERRQKLLGEIVEYHEAIKKAKQELTKLKKERDIIIKKLNLMKNKMKKASLNRIK